MTIYYLHMLCVHVFILPAPGGLYAPLHLATLGDPQPWSGFMWLLKVGVIRPVADADTACSIDLLSPLDMVMQVHPNSRHFGPLESCLPVSAARAAAPAVWLDSPKMAGVRGDQMSLWL